SWATSGSGSRRSRDSAPGRLMRRFRIPAATRLPDQNVPMTARDARPIVFFKNLRPAGTAKALITTSRQRSRESLNVAHRIVAFGVQSDFEVRRNIGDENGGIRRQRLEHNHRKALKMRRMHEQS